jgi:3-hydroxyisobutyrate dehydrogenase
MMTRVGIVGVGRMGAAMARRVAAAGLPLTVYDTQPQVCDALRQHGAVVAASPREVAKRADVVCIVVLDDQQVRAVFRGDDGLLAAGRRDMVVAIHSTIRIDTVGEVAVEAAAHGVAVVDAGVTGGVDGAEQGQLAVMVGGEPAAIEHCRPVFDCYAALVHSMGSLGTGMKAKVARQTILFLQAAAVHEGMRLAERAGVNVAALAEIVTHSERYARVNDSLWRRGTAEPADASTEAGRRWLQIARYTVPMAEKDLNAALELAASLGVDLPLTRQALERMPEVWGLR